MNSPSIAEDNSAENHSMLRDYSDRIEASIVKDRSSMNTNDRSMDFRRRTGETLRNGSLYWLINREEFCSMSMRRNSFCTRNDVVLNTVQLLVAFEKHRDVENRIERESTDR